MLEHKLVMPSNYEFMSVLARRHGSHSQFAMLSPRQLRAARSLVGWSRHKLAEASKVPAVTIGEFETGKTDPKLSTVGKLRRAMERAGVLFIDADHEAGPGVRLRGEDRERHERTRRRD